MLCSLFDNRLEHLPLILAGPILRRVESQAVTVWVALKSPEEVKLHVYETQAGNGEVLGGIVLEGSRSSIPLGKHLHVVAITATPINCYELEPGKVYAYELIFGISPKKGLKQALAIEEDFCPDSFDWTISYFDHQLPTFALPPQDLNQLKIAHGSCRKPHGGGRDALPLLDDAIAYSARVAEGRPHQLFLTGDQIYGDDVADPLLTLATEVGNTLFGWEEMLPLQGGKQQRSSQFLPGARSDIARDEGGFTAMLVNKPEKAKSHLLSLSEYCAMYLLAWSPSLWVMQFPKGKEIFTDAKRAKLWDREVATIVEFAENVGKVRRAIANIATYMISDDHDVSDDWYLNREWCCRVLQMPLGHRVVQNALTSYAIFQAWGNTPEQFEPGQPGDLLLNAVVQWSASEGTDTLAWATAAKYLGIPPLDEKTGLPSFKSDGDVLVLNRDYADGTPALKWHYTVRSRKHEVLVLDTRTWRGYLTGDDRGHEPPMLLSPTGFQQQIEQPLEESDRLKAAGEAQIELTLLVLPTNLVSLSIIDIVQRQDMKQGRVFNSDAGDSWNFNEVAFAKLLATVFNRRDRIVILTGDIHYSAAVRLTYWSRCHFGESQSATDAVKSGVLAQLTASALKNAEWMTSIINTKAQLMLLELPKDWAGWNRPPQLVEMIIMPEMVRLLDVPVPEKGLVVRQVQEANCLCETAWAIALKDENSLPDWRYRIEWLQRKDAETAVWSQPQVMSNSQALHPQENWFKSIGEVVSLIWRNRWLHEGGQIVGHANFGLVSFQWSQSDDGAKAVIQDIYWRPLWEPSSVVYSRYFVSLKLDELPPPPKFVSPGNH